MNVQIQLPENYILKMVDNSKQMFNEHNSRSSYICRKIRIRYTTDYRNL